MFLIQPLHLESKESIKNEQKFLRNAKDFHLQLFALR